MKDHREEELRLSKLFQEKQRLEAESRQQRASEGERAALLARKARDLKDLIASLQSEADTARAREAAAQKEQERQLALAQKRAAKANADRAAATERLALERANETTHTANGQTGRVVASLPSETPGADSGVTAAETAGPSNGPAVSQAADAASARTATGDTKVAALQPSPDGAGRYDIAALRNKTTLLAPAAPFSTLKGRLSKPVLGRQTIGFGDKDDIGRLATGVSFAARAGDVVISPADGTVLYSGPFRSYGQLLILDAGDGYHIVLAGMERIDVASGQFVSAGEPVALMGARRLASVQVAEFGAAEPTLYVEFRKDGKPVDPTPWWTEEPSGRTRNDS
nr:peptidoglycan DD-metalloendopeptidase family protein [Jiella flava]